MDKNNYTMSNSKYIPVKIVHYTELKKGDLVSYYLPIFADDISRWDFIVRACKGMDVLEFIEIKNGAIYYNVVEQIHWKWHKLNTIFNEQRHHLVLMKFNGDGAGCPREHEEPTGINNVKTIEPNERATH